MVNPKELRIGNLVYCMTNKLNVKVQYPHPAKVVVDVMRLDGSGCDFVDGDLEEFQPIALTPEWLEKCGFNKLNAGWINSSGSMCFYDRARDINGFYTMDYGTRNYVARFKYVHQLQNLYFALTGQELTINM